MSTIERTRGVALVTALLVVALATIAAVAMTARQQLDMRRTANVILGDQAQLYALGIEGWAAQLLVRDLQANKIDTLNDIWAQKIPPIPVDGGQVGGKVEDLQGRFNLNSLVKEGKPDQLAVDRFRRLLTAVDLDPNLAGAVIDWIDPDQEATAPGGAEDGEYLRRAPPYRTANRPMASVTELRLVAGFDDEAYQKLLPLVTALPTATAINVNTAPATVIQALADGLTAADAKAIVDARAGGFDSVDKFLKDDHFKGKAVPLDGLTVSSNYFMVTSVISFGTIDQRWNHLIMRDDKGAVRTLMRSQATD